MFEEDNETTGIEAEAVPATDENSEGTEGAETSSESEENNAGNEEETPGEEQKKDPVKGLRAAAAAERRKRQDAERRASTAEAKLESQQKPAETAEVAPKQADFDSYDDFLMANARYVARQEVKAEQTTAAATAKQNEAKQSQQAFFGKVDDMIELGETEHEGFRDAVFSMPLSDQTLNAALESGDGQEVLWALSKNPAEAERINKLSSYGQAVEIGKISQRLSNPTKKTTNAPNPIKPVNANNSGTLEYSDKMSDKEFTKRFRKRKR